MSQLTTVTFKRTNDIANLLEEKIIDGVSQGFKFHPSKATGRLKTSCGWLSAVDAEVSETTIKIKIDLSCAGWERFLSHVPSLGDIAFSYRKGSYLIKSSAEPIADMDGTDYA